MSTESKMAANLWNRDEQEVQEYALKRAEDKKAAGAKEPSVQELSEEESRKQQAEQAKQAALAKQAENAQRQLAIASPHYRTEEDKETNQNQAVQEEEEDAATLPVETQAEDSEEQPRNSHPQVVQTHPYDGGGFVLDN